MLYDHSPKLPFFFKYPVHPLPSANRHLYELVPDEEGDDRAGRGKRKVGVI
jgi:hypothetical protein